MTEDLLTPAEKAKSAFDRFIASLPIEVRKDTETRAVENTFCKNVYNEYANDFERWSVALTTAQMITDGEL